MWSIVATGIAEVFKGWFEVKKSKQEAEKAENLAVINGELDWDIQAQKAAKHSWKDEMITIIWYSPLYIGWFRQDMITLADGTVDGSWRMVGADEWVKFVGELPYWWQFGAFGIMAASFGLRWYFKQQNFKVPKS